ncbi:phenylalanine--tRNA ligase subunit beta [Microvirga sp. W0021]|uniref:Phenylalanine--tRNA ligase beta subunit n=1 Tax=Hohaiivirga grylli TaxID=3133970 RepID=A0ABV0BGP4_9HYPH
MKFTLSWLKDHLETEATLEEIVEKLTAVGLEVEEVEDKGKILAPYKVAYVISTEQHPNADRLRVCMVDIGEGAPIQVVCGAPNARTGMKSVFAGPGTYIPGKDITLGVGSIRGIESKGMLCSGAELELSEDHDGILDLPADAPVGEPYASYAGLDDPVIDVGLTPNRPDCTSIYGIARDLAAAGLGKLKTPEIKPVAGAFKSPVSVALEFADENKHLCPAFGLRYVRGVKNIASPEWMQRRLRAIGLRPINALVDITNYMTFDQGRPLHVFDAKKVKGNLTVRLAREGEEVVALDQKTYQLQPTNVVIADEKEVESIGGIMGGEFSGCDENTTDVLIESALWDPYNIAQSGRKLGIVSDARYRFERGVDPAFCISGLELATKLVLEFCGGEPSEVILEGAIPQPKKVIDFPWAEVKRLTTLDLPVAEMKAVLEKLGFPVEGQGDVVKVSVPSWRPDIDGKADIVEEIVRIAGLDQIAPAPLPRLEAVVPKAILTPIQKRTRQAKRDLATRGLVEAVTWSFISREEAKLFGGGDEKLALANPIAAELSDMRPSLLPGLLKAAQRNADRGIPNVAIFEVGQVFLSDEPDGQKIFATAVRRGLAKAEALGRTWRGNEPVDAFDAKADAVGMLAALGVPVAGLQIVPGGPAWFHPGRSATLQFGPKVVVGAFGEIHPKIARALDLKGPHVAFEINLSALPPQKAKPTKAKAKLALSDLQPLSRDFAFVVDQSVAAQDIVRAVTSADRQLISAIDIFDVYEGTGLPEGKKSVAVSVTLQPMEKTLTDVEIEAVATKIVEEVGKKTGATLR